ncbi:MAG: preprotein translocase subunit YajC [Candidatus Marinimicrobia bacterium]|nr:preprotein translocase subunit YajC [Candidatus Neomarinimicrobiota bacterium]
MLNIDYISWVNLKLIYVSFSLKKCNLKCNLSYLIRNKILDLLYAQGETGASMPLATYLPFVLMFLIFYFIIIRPQSTQRKKHEEQLANLKQGDKVLTRGGIYGTIIGFQGKNNNRVTIDAGSGTKFNVDRSYVVGLEDSKIEVK